jgi:rhamnose transport system ATP-binding protein
MNGLEFQGIRKSFGGIDALRGVSFAVAKGSVHALVGENGAGKSTLMKILAGIERPDRGAMRLDGSRIDLRAPRQALDLGIGMVHQEMLLFPNLTVSENIFAGREPTRALGRLRRDEMRRAAQGLLDDLHLHASPEAEVESLPTAQRQLVQIARALAFECRILILDEPTTCLTEGETADLFRVLERLRGRGVTLIYVSHKLDEVFRLCDAITVLRDGEHVGTFDRSATSPRDIVRSMVGRDIEAAPASPSTAAAGVEPVLSIEGLTRRPWFEDVRLAVRPGEIVALFGLVGSGRSELAETLFGVRRAHAGSVRHLGRELRARSPGAAAALGIAMVPEDRQRQGLFFNLPLRDNLLVSRERLAGRWRIEVAGEVEAGAQALRDLRIKAPGLDATPDRLSGGNQQKVVLARWLLTRPRCLLLDEPTKGVDVGAKYEIHELVRAQAAQGMACLLVSSDLPEVLALAHRIVVLREGRVQGELPAGSATEEAVMRLATAVGH